MSHHTIFRFHTIYPYNFESWWTIIAAANIYEYRSQVTIESSGNALLCWSPLHKVSRKEMKGGKEDEMRTMYTHRWGKRWSRTKDRLNVDRKIQ